MMEEVAELEIERTPALHQSLIDAMHNDLFKIWELHNRGPDLEFPSE